jgi:hypothetical protein
VLGNSGCAGLNFAQKAKMSIIFDLAVKFILIYGQSSSWKMVMLNAETSQIQAEEPKLLQIHWVGVESH